MQVDIEEFPTQLNIAALLTLDIAEKLPQLDIEDLLARLDIKQLITPDIASLLTNDYKHD